MKVFISWSGERSKALANSLRDWLPMVLQYLEPFVSDKDISAGDRWAQTIADELESSNFGIICITPENVDKEWILFEAGALSKSMLDGKVIPLLFGLELSDLGGPLSQFQAQKVDEAGIMEVVRAINKVAENKASDQIVDKLIPTVWPELQSTLESIASTDVSEKQLRPQKEILEELVTGVRGLNSRMRDLDRELSRPRNSLRRRRMRLHPGMLEDLMYMSGEKDDPPTFLLVLAGMVRADFPWLAELLNETYREIKDGGLVKIEVATQRLRRTVKHMMLHPLMREFSGGSKEAMMMAEEIPMLLDMMLHHLHEQARPRNALAAAAKDTDKKLFSDVSDSHKPD